MKSLVIFILNLLLISASFFATYHPTQVDAFNDNYCKISTDYLSEMISFFGPRSDTMQQFNYLNTELGIPNENWMADVQSDGVDSDVCIIMRKYYYTAKFNLKFQPRYPLLIMKAIANIEHQLKNGCDPSRISSITRARIVELKTFLNSPNIECDKSVFTSASMARPHAIIPELKQRPLFNGTHCYSKWTYTTEFGNIFLPEILENDTFIIHNRFYLGSNEKFYTKPPNFFPENPGTIMITRRDRCPNSQLTWSLWKNTATSTIRRDQVPDKPEPLFFKPSLEINDCNNNLIPDEQEFMEPEYKIKPCTSLDCVGVEDMYQVPEECASCYSDDMNHNDIPDQCEDCNNNGISDVREIFEYGRTLVDKNHNNILDECEKEEETKEPPKTTEEEPPPPSTHETHRLEPIHQDCNNNGQDDAVEIAKNPNFDQDGNGVLDECEKRGSCFLKGQCFPSTKSKCEKMMGGVFHLLDHCPEIETTEETSETSEPEETVPETYTESESESTNPETQTENWEEPVSTTEPEKKPSAGSCVFDKLEECIDDVAKDECEQFDGKWDQKDCYRRRQKSVPQDDENLKSFIDSFNNSSSSNEDNAIAATVIVGFISCWVVLIIFIFAGDQL